MNNSSLSNEDRDKIFYAYILPSIIKELEICENPIAHILGGQPGAGKSHFIKTIVEKYKNIAIINGDDFRGYHPKYKYFLEHNELEASDLIQKDVNYWIEKAIIEISSKKYSMIIEGTLRNANTPIKTSRLLNDAGYSVNMDIIIVNPEVSKVDAIKRYLLQKQEIGFARFTKIEAHNETIDKMFQNILSIADKKEIDCLRLFRREITDYNLFYERNFQISTEYDETDLRRILEIEQKKKLSKEDFEYIHNSWESIAKLEGYSDIKEYIQNIREIKAEYRLIPKEIEIKRGLKIC